MGTTWARYSIGIGVGAIVTVGLLFLMQALVATARKDLDETSRRYFVDFVRIPREETLERKERKLDKPLEPAAPPPSAPAARTDAVTPTDLAVDIPLVKVEATLEIGGLGLESSGGDYLPIVKAAPVYPWKALSGNVQGYCVVEYTVTETGSVRDVVVVMAEPEGYFEKASIEAALKFKYRPRVVAGQPIQVPGVRNKFDFRLEG